MKHSICILAAIAWLFAATGGALADNWWSDIGPATETQAPEPTPEPTEKPKLNLGGLLNGLLGRDSPEPQETPAPSEDIDVPDDPTNVPDGPVDVPDEPTDVPEDGAPFDPGVMDITTRPYGGATQFARVDNWTVAYGNCNDHYCILGWNEDAREYHILAETVVSDIVPVGDAFAYFGEVNQGKFGWLVRDPNQVEPVSLSLGELTSVFWSDEDYLYYFTYGKGTGTIYSRMSHDGKNKKQLGKLNGRAVAMLAGGGVVVFNSSKNRVELFQGGKSETLYAPEDEIQNVLSTGREIWVVHRDLLGLLRDGELILSFPGSLRACAASTDQIIAVLDDGAIRLDVVMLNDAYGAHAAVGQVGAQESLSVEVTPGWLNRIVIWGQRESLEFHTPDSAQWLPYEP